MRRFALLCLTLVSCGTEPFPALEDAALGVTESAWHDGAPDDSAGLDDDLAFSDDLAFDGEAFALADAPGPGWIFQDASRQCGTYVLPTPNPSGTCRVARATVRNHQQTVHDGAVNVSACVARILNGYKLPFRHDGSVFQNREHRLPNAPQGFYREYVDPTPGLRGPGPQRLVRGGQTAWYYTPDHYATFLPVACSLGASEDVR